MKQIFLISLILLSWGAYSQESVLLEKWSVIEITDIQNCESHQVLTVNREQDTAFILAKKGLDVHNSVVLRAKPITEVNLIIKGDEYLADLTPVGQSSHMKPGFYGQVEFEIKPNNRSRTKSSLVLSTYYDGESSYFLEVLEIK